MPPYQKFFLTFIPTSEPTSALKALLSLALAIDANMKWVAHLEKPIQVLADAAWMNTDAQIDVATTLVSQRAYYSASYFTII